VFVVRLAHDEQAFAPSATCLPDPWTHGGALMAIAIVPDEELELPWPKPALRLVRGTMENRSCVRTEQTRTSRDNRYTATISITRGR